MNTKLLTFCVIIAGIGLAGCGEPEKVENEVKFSDIKPMFKKEKLKKSELRAELFVITFDIPVPKYQEFANIWENLYQQGVYYSSQEAFALNGFKAGFGSEAKWKDLQNSLETADYVKTRTVFLMVEKGFNDMLHVSRYKGVSELFYYTGQSQLGAATIKNGKAGFEFEIDKIPAAKGIVEVKIMPFFEPDIKIADEEKTFFRHIGFQFDITPGQFVLLGPDEGKLQQGTLKHLFFEEPGPIEMVKVYMVGCRGIYD